LHFRPIFPKFLATEKPSARAMEQLIPQMSPAPGERQLRFVGDRVRFTIKDRDGRRAQGWQARLRTNLGRADVLRCEIIQAHTRGLPLAGASWRDLPMREENGEWVLELPLAEVGYFKAKAYLLDPKGWQHWPDGRDVGISVHPDAYRTVNTIYCAFPRMFGPSKTAVTNSNESLEKQLSQLEQQGHTVIPPSGKLRDVIAELPHIIGTLGCKILHLLPVSPVPTTYARFGRYGSPYAALDLTAIDPALVVFDKRTTGIDQFRELTYATHARGGKVFLDIVINHTGWGSTLQEHHPEWFLRNDKGEFASPGAWGVTWEDLVEIKHDNVALWDELAEMFLTWCRRGVDGFRCDAGYKVPLAAWQYIIARTQQEFPDTVFLLEGLGGALEVTEDLLTEGGMQWAYSELFQNYSGSQIAQYLDYANRQSERVGVYAHYSETHDNERLAKKGHAWSLMRNRLCALTSANGAFGFTCGVEWLATEKIKVHGSTGMAWNSRENIVAEISCLNRLLADHPCFADGAKLTRLSGNDSAVYALLRESAEGKDVVLVLVNTDIEREQSFGAPISKSARSDNAKRADLEIDAPAEWKFDLLGQTLPKISVEGKKIVFTLGPGETFCLSPLQQPIGLRGEEYRRARAQAAWAIQCVSETFTAKQIGAYDWRKLAQIVERSPSDFLAAIQYLDTTPLQTDLAAALEKALTEKSFPQVMRWGLIDRRRITPVPPKHWLLIEDTSPFRAELRTTSHGPRTNSQHIQSIVVGNSHVACFAPREDGTEAKLFLERYADSDKRVEASIRFLAREPQLTEQVPRNTDIVLLTNGRGGMARLCVDLGRIQSKYDCALGANLHPELPVDRHVFVKRIRAWVNADGFLSPLDCKNLGSFEPGPPATWQFLAEAGDGRMVEIEVRASMLEGRNTTVFHFHRPSVSKAAGKQLPEDAAVSITVRVDIEDRSFHAETKHNGGAEYHFSSNTRELKIPNSKLKTPNGFAFAPAKDRQLRAFTDAGEFHPQPEWCDNIPHPIEQSRGQTGSGDAYSPGWFELPLPKDSEVNLILTADPDEVSAKEIKSAIGNQQRAIENFGDHLIQAARAYVVKRGAGKTVIAGYPWFLDWGRDTFISARGLLAAGMIEEVKQIAITFAHFEKNGTLPNTIFGEDASNRDTSDAPLWFGIVCEEIVALTDKRLYAARVDKSGRTIQDVLESIASNYIKGTSNGIRMDAESALIWSPSHFTWMDTNYPAATPREGYPIEIQALWIRLLRLLASISEKSKQKQWNDLAERALSSIQKFFWIEDRGFYADVLIAGRVQSAAQAKVSDALRNNCLFLVSLGIISGDRAKRCVDAALRYLVVPGGLRSLAPLPVSVPLAVYSNGGLLNDPNFPYWPRYEGDEDTRRKPAYHNGTAWTWTFPVFCEALAAAWNFSPESVAAAKAYLGSMERIMREGCIGQIPEILDGDAPHAQRGCDAQAWGVTEALRVWKLLSK
jgi:starch synthase (maltosyl-transferring)